jgi:hypothetical protein
MVCYYNALLKSMKEFKNITVRPELPENYIICLNRLPPCSLIKVRMPYDYDSRGREMALILLFTTPSAFTFAMLP